MRQHSEILNFLKMHGALLNTVRPEFLLSEEDYQHWSKAKLVAMKAEGHSAALHDEYVAYTQKLERYFEYISREAWINVVMQVAKVYVFDLIDLKHFKSLPGINTKEESQLSASNSDLPEHLDVQSKNTTESLLLRWLSYSNYRYTNRWKKIQNFSDDLKDGTILGHTILAHIPEGEAVVSLQEALCAADEEGDDSTLELAVRRALSEIFISTFDESTQGVNGMNADESGAANRISFGKLQLGSLYDMLFVSCFLFQGLPQFLGKGVIEFNAKLHQTIRRSVEVANHSHKSICYNVALDTPAEFHMLKAEIVLEDKKGEPCSIEYLGDNLLSVTLSPRSLLRIPIEFTARFSRTGQGLLMLKSKNTALNNLSILLFEIRSSVEAVRPRKVYRTEAPIYQVTPATTVTLEIENPFTIPGDYTIIMEETFSRSIDEADSASGESHAAVFSSKGAFSKLKPLPGITASTNALVSIVAWLCFLFMCVYVESNAVLCFASKVLHDEGTTPVPAGIPKSTIDSHIHSV